MIEFVMLLLIGIATYMGWKESIKREPDKDYKVGKNSVVMIFMSIILYIMTVMTVQDSLIIFGVGALTIFSIPMCIADFQCYYLPKISSILFEIFMVIITPFLFSSTSYLEWGKMLGVYVIAAIILIILCLLTNFGFADAYVGAWIAIPLFMKPELLLSTLIAFLVSTLVLIVLTLLTKRKKITHVPYVPALVWTIPLTIIIAQLI